MSAVATPYDKYIENPSLIPRLSGETEEQALARVKSWQQAEYDRAAARAKTGLPPLSSVSDPGPFAAIKPVDKTHDERMQDAITEAVNRDKARAQQGLEPLGYAAAYGADWKTWQPSPASPAQGIGSGATSSGSSASSGSAVVGPSNRFPNISTGSYTGGGSSGGSTDYSWQSSSNATGLMSGSTSLPSSALVEGRLTGLLATDQHGNYTNPLVRQASERAMQAFAGRGLLNSSMAIQAAQEAAIAKAIEIAGPDAQRVFDNLRGDKDWAYRFEQDRLNNAAEIEKARILANLDLDKLRAEYGYRADADSVSQAFNLRQNYINSIANITNNYQQMVNNINQSGMRPEDKQAALADAAATRDAEAAYINDLYSKMPGWQQAWLSPAVPTRGVDINTITNVSTLRNIIADPAQPQAIRDAAQARLNQMLQQQAAQQPSGGLLNTTPEPNYA